MKQEEMNECHTISCPNCGFNIEETFVEQKCPRCQTIIESKFICGSCHHCGEAISETSHHIHITERKSLLQKLLSIFK